MEPIGLLLSSQDHATDPDIEVHEFSPQPHSLFLLNSPVFCIIQDISSPFIDILWGT